jgi:uncharacterized tellurite resistance protein B-like protein
MLLESIRALFAVKAARSGDADPDASTMDPLHVAACALLLEVAYADGEFSAPERAHLERVLADHFTLPPETGRRLIELAEAERRDSVDHFQFTSMLKRSYDTGQKMLLAEVIWGMVLADGVISDHEHYLTRKIANLLDLEPGYLSDAKRAASASREKADG